MRNEERTMKLAVLVFYLFMVHPSLFIDFSSPAARIFNGSNAQIFAKAYGRMQFPAVLRNAKRQHVISRGLGLGFDQP